MDLKTKAKLKEGLSGDVEEYVGLSITSDEKSKVLNILMKEVKMLNEEESLVLNDELKKIRQDFEIKKGGEQLELEKSRNKLEEKKHEHQMKNEQAKIKLEKEKFEHLKTMEISKNQLELDKIQLEYAKLEVEKSIKINEVKKDKRGMIFNILMKTFEIAAPLAINTLLVMMNFRLIYKDDGRSPSELKDLMKNVYRK